MAKATPPELLALYRGATGTVTLPDGSTYKMLPDRGQTFALYVARDYENWGIVHSDRCGQSKVHHVSVIPLTRTVVEAMLEAEVNAGGGTYTCKACVARKVSATED